MKPFSFSLPSFDLSEIPLKQPSRLPSRILPLILPWIPIENLFSNCLLVSRNWHRTLTLDEEFLHSIVILSFPPQLEKRFSVGRDAYGWLKRHYYTCLDLDFRDEEILHFMTPTMLTNVTRLHSQRGEGEQQSTTLLMNSTTHSLQQQYGTARLNRCISRGVHLYVFQIFLKNEDRAFVANPLFGISRCLSREAVSVDASEFVDIALVYGAGMGTFKRGHDAHGNLAAVPVRGTHWKRERISNRDLVGMVVDFTSGKVYFGYRGALCGESHLEDIQGYSDSIYLDRDGDVPGQYQVIMSIGSTCTVTIVKHQILLPHSSSSQLITRNSIERVISLHTSEENEY